MFERYTEKARRAIFFARYEASHYGSPYIECEHLLLGVIREAKSLFRWLPNETFETIRKRVDDNSPRRPATPTAVDLPLTAGAKRALKFAADEADRLAHRHIGTEHLFLGLLDEDESLAAKLLREAGADAANIREKIAALPKEETLSEADRSGLMGARDYLASRSGHIEIHGVRRNIESVREAVQRCRMYNWHWRKRPWKNIDIAVEKKTGKVSFDLGLASDAANFELIKGGWKKDHCFICRWEIFETADEDHGAGYTNGHEWVCGECYKKFWERPDFFSSAYSDIT
jgi:Clp amino terminal domain, pathogenicity island component